MEHLTVLALAIAVCLALCDASPLMTSPDDRQLAEDYLAQFYKDPDVTQRRGRSLYLSNFEKDLKAMQDFFGLEVTGKLDTHTLEVMKQPRCGDSDLVRQYQGKSIWKQSVLTYRITEYTLKLNRSEVDATIAKAFKLYSDVIPLDFKQIYSGTADIMILFKARYHGDSKPFDGPGKVLAHAYYPGPEIGGDAHFDEDEKWTLSSQGENLLLVAAHEFGHALGLDHSKNLSSIMYPKYQYVNTNGYKLSQDDRLRIQALYGVRASADKPAPKPEPKPCKRDLVFDAATRIDGELYFFKNGSYWKKKIYKNTLSLHNISSLWPSIDSVDAAYTSKEKNTAFLFKGQKYWVIRGSKTLPGYPKPISNFGFPSYVKKIDAAVYVASTSQTLFFVGSKYWSRSKGKMDQGFPKNIQQNFPGIGSRVDAAFENAGTMYFLNGAQKTKYDFRSKRANSVRFNFRWHNCTYN